MVLVNSNVQKVVANEAAVEDGELIQLFYHIHLFSLVGLVHQVHRIGEAETQKNHALEEGFVIHENENNNSHESADHEHRVKLLCRRICNCNILVEHPKPPPFLLFSKTSAVYLS